MLNLRSLLMLFAVVCLFTACGKDDDVTPTFKQADFIGTWLLESTEGKAAGTDYNKCTTKKDKLDLTETVITITQYSADCNGMGLGASYVFDGKNVITFDFLGKPATSTILELSANRMKVKTEAGLMGTFTQVYTR